jgi:hypothetical protein
MGLAAVALTGCGSSGGSDAASSGSDGSTSTSTDCQLVSLDDVKAEFPDEGIDKEQAATVDGSSDACQFTGDVKAGVMGKYTGPTTVTLVVGTYDDDATGEAQFTSVSDEVGADVQELDGFTVAAGEAKAVAKFDDGTYALATIDSPELSGPGNQQTVALLELLAANQ